MEDAYIIKGGRSLKGSVNISGAKNVALKVIVASLLFEGDVVFENIPKIRDVYELLYLVKELGGKYKFNGNNLTINTDKISLNKVNLLHASKIRVSYMLLAPLIYRFKKAYVPNPGGCRIGARPIDRVINGFIKLGIKVKYSPDTGYYEGVLTEFPRGKYRFSKPTHTGTETLILLSVFTKDKVILENVAVEPEIDDLILLLNKSGARITRRGNTIEVNKPNIKNQKLKQTRPFKISYDRNEAITYAALAGVTEGDITISAVDEKVIKKFVELSVEAGLGVEMLPDGRWRFFYNKPLKPISIETSPYPGFMTDWQPLWAILMTKAKGTSFIHERVFENRFSYVNELKKLGADIEFVSKNVPNPEEYYFFNYDKDKEYKQIIKINGGKPLHNGVLEFKDLRAGATLALAALSVEGESIVKGASILERGYEDFIKKIKGIGGVINRV